MYIKNWKILINDIIFSCFGYDIQIEKRAYYFLQKLNPPKRVYVQPIFQPLIV